MKILVYLKKGGQVTVCSISKTIVLERLVSPSFIYSEMCCLSIMTCFYFSLGLLSSIRRGSCFGYIFLIHFCHFFSSNVFSWQSWRRKWKGWGASGSVRGRSTGGAAPCPPWGRGSRRRLHAKQRTPYPLATEQKEGTEDIGGNGNGSLLGAASESPPGLPHLSSCP